MARTRVRGRLYAAQAKVNRAATFAVQQALRESDFASYGEHTQALQQALTDLKHLQQP
jgi:hypothetical protein